MKKIIITSLVIFSPNIFAHNLPYTFEAGQPIVASEVNENFADLHNRITALEEQNNSTPDNVELVGFTVVENYLSFHTKVTACPQTYTNSFPCKIDDFEKINLSVEASYQAPNGDSTFEAHFWWDKNEEELFCQQLGYSGDAGIISINDGKIQKIEVRPNNAYNCADQLLACCK